MLTEAIQKLQAQRAQIKAEIQQREAQLAKIERALRALGVAGRGLAASPVPAKTGRKMSLLGRLNIKLGALKRYGKKEEAQKVAAQIAELKAKKGA
ncbi:MAG: hypothetical protein NZ483_08970 [Verrucomicrobiae bacterium]|nr:hypothetical protein [Verrucomicrobiae bacterium]